MARRKKSKVPTISLKPNLNEGVAREIVAVLLVAFSLLLIFAMFSFGGVLATGLFGGLKFLIGFSAYLLPLIFLLIAFMLFQPAKYEVQAHNYVGFTGFVIFLSGLLHIGVDKTDAMNVANQGLGGGLVGYGLDSLFLTILNVAASTIILFALLIICVIVAANTRLSDLMARIKAFFVRGPKEEIQINEPAGAPALEIRGTLGGNRKEPKKVDEAALVAVADPDWTPPSLDLLDDSTTKPNAGNVKENAAIIQNTLSSFGIDVAMGEVNVGPTVTQYTLKPSSGVKLNKITGLEHNLALALAAPAIRVEAPIPGKSAVGVEIPNKAAASVRMKEIFKSDEFTDVKSPLTFVLGRDVSGHPAVADLASMPHLLIAGATGAGKSVMINSFLTSLLYRNSPAQLKLILVDPKRVELNLYNDVPHLLTPVIVDPEKCISALKWAVAEMERRLKLFAEVGNRNIHEYNTSHKEESMPYIVIVIDEMADLMMLAAGDVEALIVRLAQLARAAGIHLVLATQRPSVNVITGLIKANIPARIAFRVASNVDSRTILDQGGAEKLLGKGDMLFASAESPKPRRIQGVLTNEKETKPITDYLRGARQPQYNEEVLAQPVNVGGRSGGIGDFGDADDDMFEQAAEEVIRTGKASASLLQRRLRVGYARAARLLDLLEERGIVGPADGARPRNVLVSSLSETSGEAEDFE
ncbi:MAG TPA: DNA translocase FtsK 4TM domain-containing protein [Candidatus Saccharimonadales bacterium]|nr:DNA translocase FtsK 4TM domain-containing protein [Candidatus Saccharimonadales bacterium]